MVTTPRGSRARGFWIDAGMSSHTDCSFHAHERDKLKNNSCSAWHDWQDGIVFTRGPSPRNPYDIHLCTCKRTTDPFFLLDTQVEMGTATRCGFHPHEQQQGPFAAVGKTIEADQERGMSHDTTCTSNRCCSCEQLGLLLRSCRDRASAHLDSRHAVGSKILG